MEAIRELYATGHLYLEEIAERHCAARTHVGYIVSGERRGESPAPIPTGIADSDGAGAPKRH